MKEKCWDRQENSSYQEIRVKRVWVNEFQLYILSYSVISDEVHYARVSSHTSKLQ